MPYAVDIAALTSLRVRNDLVLQMLLKRVIDLDPAHAIDDPSSGGITKAALFTCDEERAQAVVTVIRKRYAHYELPLYYSKTGKGGWKSVQCRGGREDG